MNDEKKRWPRAQAIAVAKEMCDALKPFTNRLIVAGSLRRLKPDVGDVEIVYIPKFEARKADMFITEQVNLVDEALIRLLAAGVIYKRPSKTNCYSWGDLNKLALHTASGIPVDFFATADLCWWNYLVCRTGPGTSNIAIASAAKAMGWRWNPYGPGFSRGDEVLAVGSEQEVFTFVNLPYKKPEDR